MHLTVTVELPHYARQPLYLYTHRRTFTSTPAARQGGKEDHDAKSLSNDVRLLMRRVPYPVAIITATDPLAYANTTTNTTAKNSSSSNNAYRGMTVSSFSTVTLNPEPIISFNVRRPSETLTALLSSQRFLVHLLAPGSATAALARDFSRGNRNHDLAVISGEGAEFEYVPYSASAVSETGDKDGGDCGVLPLLRRKTSTSTSTLQDDTVTQETPFILECALHPHQMEVYDHTIVLGRVVRTIVPQQLQRDGHSLCLTYADTRFWGMGNEIKDS